MGDLWVFAGLNCNYYPGYGCLYVATMGCYPDLLIFWYRVLFGCGVWSAACLSCQVSGGISDWNRPGFHELRLVFDYDLIRVTAIVHLDQELQFLWGICLFY